MMTANTLYFNEFIVKWLRLNALTIWHLRIKRYIQEKERIAEKIYTMAWDNHWSE